MMNRESFAAAFALLAVGAGVLLEIAGWLEPYRPLEFVGLTAIAILLSAWTVRQPAVERRGTMAPSFVVEFSSLLFFGSGPAMLVAAAAALMKGRLADPENLDSPRQTLSDAFTGIVSIQAAGFAHRALGGTIGQFVWPAQGIPIAGAVVAYGFVKGASIHVLGPLLARRRIDWTWPATVLRECQTYFIGAGFAVGLAEILSHRSWQILPVAAFPLFFAYRAYSSHVRRLEEDHRRREIIDDLDQGMSVVDTAGKVTLWNDALERLVGCPRERVLGRCLLSAVPSLRHSGLSRAMSETLKDRTARILSCLTLQSGTATRTLEIKILPVADGVTLVWHDVTERTRTEQVLQRRTDRLALAADGANDGLWEWDLRTQEFYVSGRWRTMLGLSESIQVSRPEDWIDRVHPDDATALHEALKMHLAGQTDHFQHQHRIRHEDGSYRWVLCRAVAGRAGRHPARIAGSLTDITDRVDADERLRSAGFLDPLTGLRNRADFAKKLGQRLEEFKRRPGSRFAVLYLDLDRFKVVNDSLGHLVGDELLIAVSRRLESCLRQQDCLSRLGGDEFAVLLNTVDSDQQANAIASRIQDALRAPLSIAGREVFTSVSIGIAIGQAEYTSPDEIMRDADTAMYHAKSNGRKRHELFDADMHARVRDRLGLESDLRHAVNNADFEVHYQPIVLLSSRMCVGFESLIRWTRNGEHISPATFIPMAEELGLMEPIGTWVLQQACQTFADWQRRFPAAGLNCITVNASSRQLTQPQFPYLVEQAVRTAGLKPGDLRIEVTETALMDTPHLAAEVLSRLRDFGVKIYLDDFGTGCSSLSHLHKLPVDALKVDRSFVMSLLLPNRPAIVESILALARTLNTSVVAEGIESEVQARELERLGCTHAQGYYFSRPLSVSAAEDLIRANQALGPKPLAVIETSDAAPFSLSKPIEWPDNSPHDAVEPASCGPGCRSTSDRLQGASSLASGVLGAR